MRDAKYRQIFIWVFLFLILIGIVIRMMHLQIIEKKELQRHGHNRSTRTEVIAAKRGIIRDRTGKPLAVTTAMSTVFVDPKQLNTTPEKWAQLLKLLQLSPQKTAERLHRYQNKHFMYLKRRVAPPIAKQLRQLKIPGIYFKTEYKRFYPHAEVAAQLIGFTNIQNQGQEGIELMYNNWLSGVDGERRVIRDLKGNVISNETLRQPQPGKDITLSIDSRLQALTFQALKSAVIKDKAASGSAVILDAKTSEILAIANWPTFNPNDLNKIEKGSTRNRAITDIFEPGSVFKPFAMAAVLSSGKYQPGDVIGTYPGRYRIGGNIVRDPRSYGEIPLHEVIRKSSNVGISRLVLSVEPEYLPDTLRKIGIGQKVGLGFPGESAGSLSAKQNWKPFALATLSFGYGVAATTLQVAQGYSILANGGKKQTVSLLKKEQLEPAQTVLDPQVASQVLQMLKAVVARGGTGVRAQVKGYEIAGKTGTARKAIKGGYADDQYTVLFAGIAPADNPKYVMVIMVDDPRGDNYYGGTVAAPVFAKVMSQVLPLNL